MTVFKAFLLFCGLAAAGCSASPRQGFDVSPTDPARGDNDPNTPGGGDAPPAQPDKPGCAQDQYTETLPSSKASLSGLSFSQTKANEYLLGALERRYPLGKAIVEGGLASSISASQGSCVDRFLQDRSSASAVLRQAATVVHECGHFYDLGEASGQREAAYVLRPNELTFTCKSGDTTSRGGKTFARSLIKKDAYYSERPACGGKSAQGCDFYADVYLDGNATDSKFDSGDQGFSFVLEEATQYVNSLATALAFEDQYTGQKVSERDGILTFLWYIERYLAMARAEYPEAYKLLSEDECWRQATLSVWDRGWFYLRASEGKANLGLDDSKLETLVTNRELTTEIDALRKLECQ